MYSWSISARPLRRPRLALLASLVGVTGALQAAVPDVAVVFAPSPLPTPAGSALVYELSVRNPANAACVRLTDVLAQGGSGASAIQLRYQGRQVAARTFSYTADIKPIAGPAPFESPHPVDIQPGAGAIVYLTLHIADGKPVPASLQNRLTFTACTSGPPAAANRTVVHDVAVSTTPPVVIGLPFHGEGWVAGDAVTAAGVHRRVITFDRDAAGNPIPTQLHAPERFAIDWVMVDAEGRREIGPVDENASYLVYGQEVVAVADGVIAHTRDEFPDQIPPYPPPGGTTEDLAAGNYIMLDIGGGNFALYAHLQRGSQRVVKGERVRRGQVIALVGNSGNSTEAHLHFHVSNAVHPLYSDGVPYVFDRFAVTGQVDGLDEETGRFLDYVAHDAILVRALMPRSFSVVADSAGPPRLRPPLPPHGRDGS